MDTGLLSSSAQDIPLDEASLERTLINPFAPSNTAYLNQSLPQHQSFVSQHPFGYPYSSGVPVTSYQANAAWSHASQLPPLAFSTFTGLPAQSHDSDPQLPPPPPPPIPKVMSGYSLADHRQKFSRVRYSPMLGLEPQISTQLSYLSIQSQPVKTVPHLAGGVYGDQRICSETNAEADNRYYSNPYPNFQRQHQQQYEYDLDNNNRQHYQNNAGHNRSSHLDTRR